MADYFLQNRPIFKVFRCPVSNILGPKGFREFSAEFSTAHSSVGAGISLWAAESYPFD